MAEKIERVFLSNGMDARVYVSGKENTVLTVEYVLLNRAFAYKMTNEGDFYENTKKAGFKKLVFDNKETTWTYDLTK